MFLTPLNFKLGEKCSLFKKNNLTKPLGFELEQTMLKIFLSSHSNMKKKTSQSEKSMKMMHLRETHQNLYVPQRHMTI